jgi:hypothetical protein
MNRYTSYLLALGIAGLSLATNAFATNPIITEQFTADPTARVFDGKIYVYPSHDIPYSPGKGRTNWFIMEDYHVYSTEDLNTFQDHGMILNQTNVPWLNGRQTWDMWAPDCVFKNGKYYFYYPVSMRIGVAIADKPYGPFVPEPTAMPNVRGIDPGVLIDDDGSAYMFWSGISMAKLKTNMVEIEGQAQQVQNLPRPGTIEGPFPFKRNGIYYLTYPHVKNNTERLEYSTATSPLGPYEWRGVFMDELESGCWTIHQSIIQYKGEWILFYHDKQLSPGFDKNRSAKADYLHFNEDGTIQKVIPTLRGVGTVDAKSKIQIDRYTAISSTNDVSMDFIDTKNVRGGWKIALTAKDAWVQFDRVEFGKTELKSVNIQAQSATGGKIEIRADKADGPVLATVEIPKSAEWKIVNAKVSGAPTGMHNLFVSQKDANNVEIDWVSFE